jgi:hypothetical protein
MRSGRRRGDVTVSCLYDGCLLVVMFDFAKTFGKTVASTAFDESDTDLGGFEGIPPSIFWSLEVVEGAWFAGFHFWEAGSCWIDGGCGGENRGGWGNLRFVRLGQSGDATPHSKYILPE